MKCRPPAPLVPAAACLAIGSLAVQIVDPPAHAWISWMSILVSISGLWFSRYNVVARSAALACLLISLSYNNACFHARFGHDHISVHLEPSQAPNGVQVTAKGQVASAVIAATGRTTFTVGNLCLQIRTSCIRVSGKIRVSLGQGVRGVGEGDRVVVSGLLQPPRQKRNPADFDVVAWLESNGLSATMSRAQLLQHRPATSVYRAVVNRIRTAIRKTVNRVVPEPSRDLPQALLLGDRSKLTTATRNDFARSGLMHLLAISGLHVLFVGMMLHRLIRPALTRIGWSWQVVESIRSGATLALLILYAVVSGASPSVVRAVIMTGFLLIATVVRSVSNPMNALGGAAFAILSFDPLALYNVGFQLSFSAVAGLLMMGRGFAGDLDAIIYNPIIRRIVAGVSASLVATLSTAPILLYRFGYVGLAGILLNLVAIPLGAALLCASMLAVLVGVLSTGAALPLGAAVDILSRMLKLIAQIGGSSDLLVVSTPYVAAFSTTFVLVLIALLSSKRGVFRRRTLLAAAMMPCAAILAAAAHGGFSPKMEVLFLDVGHGDAAIVKLPDDRVLLIDAGNRHQFRDEGERTVIPHLVWLRATGVDVAVVSHPHADHLGGIPFVLKNIPVGCVSDNGQFSDTALYEQTINIIQSQGRCHRSLSAGDTLNLGPLVRVFVLAPSSLENSSETNDHSVVLKIIFGRTSFLFTGDIESEAEKVLVSHYCELLASDVVKVPHHGSRTSSTQEFVRCASKRERKTVAVISVGRPEKYGLPDEEIVERWKIVSAVVHTTFKDGAMWVRSDGQTIKEVVWK